LWLGLGAVLALAALYIRAVNRLFRYNVDAVLLRAIVVVAVVLSIIWLAAWTWRNRSTRLSKWLDASRPLFRLLLFAVAPAALWSDLEVRTRSIAGELTYLGVLLIAIFCGLAAKLYRRKTGGGSWFIGQEDFGFIPALLLAIFAAPVILNGCNRAMQKRTMARLYDLGESLDRYVASGNQLPLADDLPVEEILDLLSGFHSEPFNPRDGWVRMIHFRSNGIQYVIWSYGWNGRRDREHEIGEFTRSNGDLILATGGFCTWPEGIVADPISPLRDPFLAASPKASAVPVH
jgi:hypothetical protein